MSDSPPLDQEVPGQVRMPGLALFVTGRETKVGLDPPFCSLVPGGAFGVAGLFFPPQRKGGISGRRRIRFDRPLPSPSFFFTSKASLDSFPDALLSNCLSGTPRDREPASKPFFDGNLFPQ